MVAVIKSDERMDGFKVNNQPEENCGHLTGKYFIDHHGCWWQLVKNNGDTVWMIGYYPLEETG